MKRVLFICLGNICRSPMAEAIFRDLVRKEGLQNRYTIDSAGTSGWHEGECPHEGTLKKLKQYDISTEGMYSRPLVKEDAAQFDYFICMDDDNVRQTKKIVGDVRISKLLDTIQHETKNVPDPYYTGDFEETYTLCLESCKQLLRRLEN
ncbi:low molecular weight protein-tyrosine-phosphatase [Kurthia senegalensis]|uniref:low molecular weight protein-tyrosine-phosphatase n=1 Tax=Kurthia senegalensis TaxID=1033740 RepID=UPI000288EC12|nr:low molecular weight protein-tyrosine-phosphatase [Kurthia senegalensis]